MAHVWNVIDGDIYVSKNGDDVAGDGSMAAPYASINKATDVGADGNKIVIGTGVWEEARGTSTNNYYYVGDGKVIFLANGGAYFYTPTTTIETFESIIFKNSIYQVFRRTASVSQMSRDLCHKIINCSIEELGSYNNAQSGFSIGVNCYNTLIYLAGTRQPGYVSCYFTNCTLLAFKHEGTYSQFFTGTFVNSIVLNYNQIGDYVGYPVIYDLGYNLVSESNTLKFLNNSTILNLVPKFNNPSINEYTLQTDSPCLFAGKNNATIGAFGLGYSFDANSSEFTEEGGAVFSQTALENDIIRTQQTINGVTRFLFQLASGHASGNVESAWIDLQTIRYLLITRLFANIIYNAFGVATSRPDNLETSGEKAVFYDFELKYCNEESEKATAVWKNVIWNKAVTIDNTGRGNADPAFIASEAQYISARFIKIKLYMTEA